MSPGRRWKARAFAGLAFISAIACAGHEPTPPQRVRSPNEVPLPADVDLAVRLDATALGADLGEGPTHQFLRDALGRGEPQETVELLERALRRATVLWLGVATRNPSGPEPTASSEPAATSEQEVPSQIAAGAVVVMRGRFAELVADGRAWTSRGAGVDALELSGSTDGYARIYRLRGNELVIWAPRAELEAVELAIRGEPTGRAPRPPERGAISIAARPEGLIARYGSRYPELAERLRGLRAISAFAEPTSGMWRADLTLDFASAEQASVVSTVAENLKRALAGRPCAVGTVARALVVSSFESNLRVQLVLLGPEVASVKACVFGNDCCA
jgi:hypothetical protein